MIMNLPAAYHILDLPVGSSLEVVQVRYRKLVKQYHPDRFLNTDDKARAEARLKLINEAKEVIQKHWFEAKVEASEPIPTAAPETKTEAAPRPVSNPSPSPQARPKPSQQANSRPKPQSNPLSDPLSDPQPNPQQWWQQVLQLCMTDLQAWFKKVEKKGPLDDALEQLDKPFKFTSETRLRRIWFAVAIIIIVDILTTGYLENRARHNAKPTTARVEEPRTVRGLTQVTPVTQVTQTPQIKQEEQQKRLETAIYFKRLELDAAERAIRKDSELMDEIEIKLQTEDMANENRRSLAQLKVLRELDKKQKELERTSILEELSQLYNSKPESV